MISANCVEKWKNTYVKLAQMPIPLTARIDIDSETIRIQSVWSNRIPVLKKATKTQRIDILMTKNFMPLNGTSLSISNFE